MKNYLIFSLFIVSILTLCGCTVDAAGGQLAADVETTKKLAFSNLEHGLAADMVCVEGGTFQMGSTENEWEMLVHEVTVSSFYMGRYEVTQAEYAKIMGNNPSEFKGKRLPVERVTWYEAVDYCNRRSEAEGLTPCYTINGTNVTCNWGANGYRLPTEAEWEYAARGGIHKSQYKYSGSNNIKEVAWHYYNSDNRTHEVGKKKANALELYDMSGNVWEWCWDWYGSDYYSNSPANNPLGPASGSGRVIRGGGWDFDASDCRCACRDDFSPDNWNYYLGFRVVCSAITADSTGGQPSADLEPPKSLAFGNLGHGSADDMVYVEGGTFQMGSTENKYEMPVHKVTVSSFYMGRYEVTQVEYAEIMENNPSKFKGEWRPVDAVSWYNAVEYCNRRSKAEGFTPCYSGSGDSITCNWNANGYRLPTEAEWEYAARGGTFHSPYTYSGSDNIKEVAWYYYNSGNQTHEVGTKEPNALGIYDMSGNVWEWCWDWYNSSYCSSNAETDPLGPNWGVARVMRGGGWRSGAGGWSLDAGSCRCAFRSGYYPDGRYLSLGFRIVRSRK